MHVVTAAEAAAGAFTMEDVVLPLPGGKVQYPQHQTAQVAKTALHAATASPSPTLERMYEECRLREQSGVLCRVCRENRAQ